MTLSKNTHKQFNQDDYTSTFYYCDNNHPFVAFTTCYCPLCDSLAHSAELIEELNSTEEELDTVNEEYEKLVLMASKTAPELLI